MKAQNKKVSRNVAIDSEMDQFILEEADQRRVSYAEIVRRLLEKGVNGSSKARTKV